MTSPSSVSPNETLVFSEDDIARTLKRLTHEMLEANHGLVDLVLVGIVTRGQYLAKRVADLVEQFEGQPIPVGVLDVTLYRDDASNTVRPTTQSVMPVDITGKTVVLVDDVLYRGRTVRAALDALTDYGRPKAVQLMVLLDRGHRQFPISPDFVGKNIPTAPEERVNVRLREVDADDHVTIQR